MSDIADAVIMREDLPAEILGLVEVVESSPLAIRQRLSPILDCMLVTLVRRTRILDGVQEAMSQLRLDMKYLMFDLEATRRERDALRRLLDENDEA